MNFLGGISDVIRRGVTQYSRIGLHQISSLKECVKEFHSMHHPLQFQCTPVLHGEPLKKKRKVDPAAIRVKVERKMRRLTKDIRRLERVSKKLKPISEMELPRKILRDSARKRPAVTLTEEEEFYRIDLQKEWAAYRRNQHEKEKKTLGCIQNAQEKALDALQEASPELYEQALQIDPALIPFKMTGPVETPPIKDYLYPEGDFIDITKVYVPVITSTDDKKKKIKFKKK